jgi:hypothetical protein
LKTYKKLLPRLRLRLLLREIRKSAPCMIN